MFSGFCKQYGNGEYNLSIISFADISGFYYTLNSKAEHIHRSCLIQVIHVKNVLVPLSFSPKRVKYECII